MKTYYISREETQYTDEVRVTVEDTTGLTSGCFLKELTPDASLKQHNHSPTGFNFGYGGSGPAQLALTILMDYTGKVPHPALYQGFKFMFIAPMKDPGGVITGVQIDVYINNFDGDKFMLEGEKP